MEIILVDKQNSKQLRKDATTKIVQKQLGGEKSLSVAQVKPFLEFIKPVFKIEVKVTISKTIFRSEKVQDTIYR